MRQLMTDEEYSKALFQYRGAVTQVLSLYNLYGLGVYNERGAITGILEKLAIQLHHRLSGFDVPIGNDFDFGGPDG